MKIYLAGPINGCSDSEAITWRQWFKEESLRDIEVDFIDPMKRDYRGKELSHYREIVDLDKIDIRNADVIVVMYVKPSVGTSMEVFYAWTLGKPVIIINESKSKLSPWLIYHSTTIVTSKEACEDKIREWV